MDKKAEKKRLTHSIWLKNNQLNCRNVKKVEIKIKIAHNCNPVCHLNHDWWLTATPTETSIATQTLTWPWHQLKGIRWYHNVVKLTQLPLIGDCEYWVFKIFFQFDDGRFKTGDWHLLKQPRPFSRQDHLFHGHFQRCDKDPRKMKTHSRNYVPFNCPDTSTSHQQDLTCSQEVHQLPLSEVSLIFVWFCIERSNQTTEPQFF